MNGRLTDLHTPAIRSDDVRGTSEDTEGLRPAARLTGLVFNGDADQLELFNQDFCCERLHHELSLIHI